jgi:hypothetical protein
MLRRLFMASVAATALASPTLAADLAPIAAAPAFTWAGFNVGARPAGADALPGRLRLEFDPDAGRYRRRAYRL